ncbi:MAG: EAL domain-containing protein [Acidobacteriota bacterium]|nr:EAL domain-containing protein [Acidobacteriota bacterium]
MEGGEGAATASRPDSLGHRLLERARDPAVLSNPPVAALFCVLRAFHLIAPVPYWLLVLIVAAGGTTAIVVAATWGDDRRSWHMPAYVAVNMAVVTVVAYATGWGPILAVGYLFGSGTAFRLFGSRVTRPAIVASASCMTVGQTGIGLGLVPSLIGQPLVHGLAALSLLGTLLTIGLLGRVTAEREAAVVGLRQSERRFKALVSNASDIIIVVDPGGMLEYVSPAFERQLGISAAPYFARSAAEFIHPVDVRSITEAFPLLAADPSQSLETRVRIRDGRGRWRHFETTITDRTHDPDVRGIVGNLHDITELLEANERFRSAFEDAPIGIALTSLDGRIQRANRAFGTIVGLTADGVVGIRIQSLSCPQDAGLDTGQRRLLASGHSEGFELEKRLQHADGHEVWAHVHVSVVRDSGGRPLHLIEQIQDVTDQRRMRDRLAHAAIHDPLTGLPNRTLFLDRLGVALSRAQRQHHQVAVAFLDLDRFKLVNDGLGHGAGDDLLQAVAQRIAGALRDEDTVARFGGDEFTILWEGVADEAEAVTVARRVLEELQRPFDLQGSPVYVSASIGVALTDGTALPSSLLRDADAAMYLAKDEGRGRVAVFDGKGHAVALESLHVMNELHRALAQGEFRVHYQAIVDVETQEVVGSEALVRWMHPDRGLLLPDQFIKVAEDCGLIVPLGDWVLTEACRQTARWNRTAAVRGVAPVEINVNVSPRQLASPDFPAAVERALSESRIDPSLVCLEITEGTLMRDERAAADALGRLRALGVQIGIDDFGTGYSSLSYLKHFPIDSLKVDRTFVEALGAGSDESAIVAAVVGLAHSLGLVAVAEGVETERAMFELRRLGCDRAQGFLLSRPAPVEEHEHLLFEARRPAPARLGAVEVRSAVS